MHDVPVSGDQDLSFQLHQPAQRLLQLPSVAGTDGRHDGGDDGITGDQHPFFHHQRTRAVRTVTRGVQPAHRPAAQISAQIILEGDGGPREIRGDVGLRLSPLVRPTGHLIPDHSGCQSMREHLAPGQSSRTQHVITVAVGQCQAVGLVPPVPDEGGHGISVLRVHPAIDGQGILLTKHDGILSLNDLVRG